MKEIYARLTSFERRVFFFFVILALIIFTLFVVRPMFKQWDEINARRAKAEKTLDVFKTEIDKSSFYRTNILILGAAGAVVAQEDQGVDFALTIQRQAAASKVNIIASTQQQGKTNVNFFEKAQALTVNAGEENLVDFLFNLGEGASLIRVRDISLRPADAQRSGLTANMKLVASYQKKTPPPPKPATPTNAPAVRKTEPAPATKPATKPAAAPATKPLTPTKK